MDLLEDIRRKTAALEGQEVLEGVKAVVRHIEVAERYLAQARTSNEDDLFNDVIYRTNQAFEGMLKEAYTVLTSKDGSKLSPNQIEQHLLQEKVLASRVLELFKNYRQNWRNPSTHDHRLIFGEQEALLAIVSISAFTNILLDQIIEGINYKKEQERSQQLKEVIEKALEELDTMSFPEEVIYILKMFGEITTAKNTNLAQLSEVEIIGRLHGFIESLTKPFVTVINNPLITSPTGSALRPDLILRRFNETVIIEVKRPIFNRSILEHGTSQLLAYLGAAGAQDGILFIPTESEEETGVRTLSIEEKGKNISIHYVVPKQLL